MFQLGDVHVAWHSHPEVIALAVGLVVAYLGLIRKYAHVMHPRPDEVAVTRGQKAWFFGGVAMFWVASGSPLHDISEQYLYSAHMLQHLIQVFVIPPMLLMGVPTWMGEVLLSNIWVRRTVQGLAKPLVAALLFNGFFAAIHWPAIVNGMIANELFHGTTHILLIGAAFAMWMNLVSPVPHIVPRLKPLPQMAYLFLMTLLPTIPASFLTFGDTPLFTVYETMPRVWEGFTALDDMRVAGLIMKIGGGFYLWGIITVLFFKWATAEERSERAGGGPSVPSRIDTPNDVPTA